MAAPPYQKFFWGSYHKHTAHLRHAREHGAYLLLLGALWNNGGKLPSDDEALAGYALLSAKEWAAVKPKLMPLFRLVRGKLTQPRVSEDLAKYESTSCKRKEAGKAGGTASAGKHKGNGAAIATGLLPVCRHNQNQNHKEEEGSEDKSSGGEVAAEREDFDATAWILAVRVLTSQGTMAEKAARTFFGGALSKHKLTARDLLPSLTQAAVTGTLDPKGYITKAAQGIAKRRGANGQPVEQVDWC